MNINNTHTKTISLDYGHVGGYKKAPERGALRGLKNKDEATTYSTASAVPSALGSLTSVFGMGTGGTSAL